MKIGILGDKKPIKNIQGNVFYIGKILQKRNKVDIIGFKKGNNPKLKDYFNFRQYTNIKPTSYFKWVIRDIINLWRYCREEKPDVLFSMQRPDFQGPLVVLFSKLFGIKSVVRFSGGSFDMYKYKKCLAKIFSYLDCKLIMPLIRKADRIICMGEDQKKELTKQGVKRDKINIILQPTDTDRFKPPKSKGKIREKLNLPKDKKIILYVGNLTNFKGADTLLRVVEEVQLDDYFFVFVGEDREKYKNKFAKFDNVKLTGRILPNEVPLYYQAADLYIHPSYIEGFPKTLLEAAACGLPSIARDIVGVGRVATKTFKKDEELIGYILKGSWEELDKSKSRLPNKYSWNNLEKKYLDLFDKID